MTLTVSAGAQPPPSGLHQDAGEETKGGHRRGQVTARIAQGDARLLGGAHSWPLLEGSFLGSTTPASSPRLAGFPPSSPPSDLSSFR